MDSAVEILLDRLDQFYTSDDVVHVPEVETVLALACELIYQGHQPYLQVRNSLVHSLVNLPGVTPETRARQSDLTKLLHNGFTATVIRDYCRERGRQAR